MKKNIKTIKLFLLITLFLLLSNITSTPGITTGYNSTLQNNSNTTSNTLFQHTETTAITQDTSEITNTTKNYWAVLIGLNNYPGTQNDLPFSVNEITSFQHTLLSCRNWKESNINILLDDNATNISFQNAIQWLDENEDANDVSIFYFAGHGGLDTYNHEYIRLFDTKITDQVLDTQLDNLEGNVIIILDCCNSGGFIEELHQNNRIILTACEKDELAYQDYNLHSGIYGYFLNISLKFVKSAEMAFKLTYTLCIYYGKKISKEYGTDYTFHPVMDDNTIGLSKIITWRIFFPRTSAKMTSILSRFSGLKIWVL